MDHSLRGYLSRRTTEELDQILNKCLENYELDLNKDVIRMILDILRKREMNTGKDTENQTDMK